MLLWDTFGVWHSQLLCHLSTRDLPWFVSLCSVPSKLVIDNWTHIPAHSSLSLLVTALHCSEMGKHLLNLKKNVFYFHCPRQVTWSKAEFLFKPCLNWYFRVVTLSLFPEGICSLLPSFEMLENSPRWWENSLTLDAGSCLELGALVSAQKKFIWSQVAVKLLISHIINVLSFIKYA